MTTLSDRQVISINDRRSKGDWVVYGKRRISKGRARGMTEYSLAPLQDSGKAYAMKMIGEALVKEPKGTYTDEQITEAIFRATGTKVEVDKRRHETKERGREALDGILVGDTILIRGRNCPNWTAEVTEVNWKTGKVGIPKHGTHSYQDDIAGMFEEHGLMKRRGGSKHRWVHPDCIIEVRSQEKPLPVSISDRAMEQMAERGWAQMTFGSEFIEHSYVVAVEKNKARNGTNYECAEGTVYLDKELGVFWRRTGSFD